MLNLDDIKEISLLVSVIIVVLLAVIALPLTIGANAYNSWRCEQYQEMTGRNTEFRWFDACYIRSGDNWLSQHEYAATITAREGLEANQ